jgi:hypothetical protein
VASHDGAVEDGWFEDEELGGASIEWARRPGGRRGVRKQEVQTC